MGYEHYHFNEVMTDAMLDRLEKAPDFTVVSGTTHYHYYSPYYAGDWLVWHIPTYHTDGYYTYAVTSHSASDDDPKNSDYEDGDKHDYYYNFNAITGVNFLNHSAHWSNVGLYIGDNTNATNLTFGYGDVEAGMNASLNNLTFTNGGIVQLGVVYDDEEEVIVSSTGIGNVVSTGTVYYATTDASMTNLKATKDFERVVALNGGRSYISGVDVARNMRELVIAAPNGSYGVGNSKLTGLGTVVNAVTVSGRLSSAYVGNGAVLNSLTVGSRRSWTAADSSAFVWYDSSWGSWTHSSATYMTVDSGGTATNIYLGNGGDLYVSGPSDTVTSQYNSSTSEWVVTSHFASGQGGVVSNLRMATAAALQIDGVTDVRAIWNYPSNGYSNSSSYMSGFLATAPQSAYVWFASNTVGCNISIGNGGTMTVDKGGRVTNISMGALTTSTYYTNSSGGTDTWIGDRGAKLTVNGGFASDVIIEAAPMTFDYYSAAHNYFYRLSSSIGESMQNAYYSSHGEYPTWNDAWRQQIYNSASAGYRQYMSSMFVSGAAVYTNYGDDTGYNRKWVGGEVSVANGGIYNLYGFATLRVTHIGEGTSSAGSVTYSAFSMENVSKASGVVSATVEVGGGAHLTSVTAPGGYVVMGYGSGIYRWAGQSNPQSNFARVEHLDLRTSELVGDNNSAVIFFSGYTGGGGWSTPRKDSKGNTIKDDEGHPIYDSYSYLCVDPGEVVYASGDSGLTVQGTYGKFTYTGSGAIVFGGLGTVVTQEFSSRYYSSTTISSGSSTYKTVTRWLAPAVTHYEFGVLKGVYDEETGKLAAKYVYDGEGGFDWKGVLAVGSGAVVEGIGSKAALYTANDIASDTWNPVIDQDLSKMLYVVAGGSADNITVQGKVKNYEVTSKELYRGNAALVVSTGGTATNVRVMSDGIAMAIGGTIDKVFVDSGGILYLSGWGGALQVSSDGGSTIAGPQHLDTTVLNAVQLNAGGQLGAVYDYQFGGKAPSIIANSGGGILNGVTANGVAYASGVDFAGNLTLAGGQKGVDLTVRGYTKVTSRDSAGNPTAWTTTIATLNVSAGGTATGTTVAEEGAIYVSEGAIVNSTIIASGGRMIFENPGSGWGNYLPASATVDGIDIRGGGILQINSKYAVSATDVKINASAGMEFHLVKDASEDYAKTELDGTWTASWGSGTFHTNDGVLTGFGGEFGYEYVDPIYSRTYTSARLSMYIRDNAVLSGGDIRGCGFFNATSGGKVLGTKIRGVTANIGVSGYASGLYATTESTGSAYDTNIYVYGSGAVVENTVLSGGFLAVERSGVANGVTMLAPEGYAGPMGNQNDIGPAELEIAAGGTVRNVVASAGVITMYEGSKEPGTASPTLSNADVHYSATLIVKCDGAVLDGTLNLGGLVTTTATRYEYVEVQVTDPATGNTYTDWQRVEKNNAVAEASTLTVNFDLTERDGSDEDAMIDNLANLAGAKLGTITVSADQAEGTYVLAQGAADFTGSVTVKRGTENLGAFTVGTYYQYDEDTMYSLTNDDETGLCFTIQSTGAAVSKIVATVDGRELLAGQWANKSVTIKAQGNKSTKSLWYRIHKAVITRGGAKNGDEWLELDGENGVTISEFCDIEIRAKDAKGNYSKSTTYRINYDATPAEISDFRSDTGGTNLAPGTEAQVSVLVSDDLDDAPTLKLLTGNDEWTDVVRGADDRYAFTVTRNGKYTLRAVDHAGNVTTSVVTVDFYETSIEPPTVKASTTKPTNKNITITATFSKDSAKKQYSTDNKTWQNYTAALTATKNGTWYFRATDAVGNQSVTTFKVTNIDKTAPAAPTLKASTTKATNQNVTITAAYSSDSVKKQYSTDNKSWKDCADTVSVGKNGTYYFRSADAAGNVSKVASIKVANIDKTAPAAPTVKSSNTKVTNKNITITATFSKDSSKKQYSTDNKTWSNYSKALSVGKNGTYYFRGVDAAGNASKVTSIKVANIDKTAPTAPTVKASTTAFTNKNVTITATFSKDSAKKQYSTDKKTWQTYSKSLAATKNGTWYFRGVDAAGNVSAVTTIKVANIDKTAPVAPAVKSSNTKLTNKNITITATFSKDSAKKQYSTDNKTWKNYTEAVSVGKNGTYYFRGIDAAGNVSKVVSIKVANIDKTAPAAPTVKVNTANAAKSVTITATFSKDSAKKQYSTDKKTWKNYSKAISVNANGTYYFRGIDAAGNQSKVNSVKVANIVDTNNNKWTGATELTGTVLAALDKKADPVDYYDVGDVAQLMVDMNKGETAITFYDGDKKAVAVTELTMADGSVMGNVSSLTLATGNATRDHFTIAALDDAVKYLKIETAGSNVAYQISKLA